MGNCVSGKKQGGDYEESPAKLPEKSTFSGEPHRDEEEDSGDRFSSCGGGKRRTTEVKIKITKKQLEELLGMKEVQGMTVEQVLTRLINGGDGVFESAGQRSWRPALHTIPE
ncbi:hypothetical protein SSX86_000414 [Deinandra increscens subsp. villosa]|uniref:Uncharacterized protein n=1 Tax=Deinandra increscens subsp. villosa TaxID=3103831 RepID=A0AAP0HDG5_9ASTR